MDDLNRKQHILVESNLKAAEPKELDDKSRIKTESEYVNSSTVVSSGSKEIKVKIEDSDRGSEYKDDDMAKPSRKKARIFKEGDNGRDIAYWKSLVKKNPADSENWEALVVAYRQELAVTTTDETSGAHEGATAVISRRC